MSTYSSIRHIAGRLALTAMLGLAPAWLARAGSMDDMATGKAMYTSFYRSGAQLYSQAELERTAGRFDRALRLYDQAAQVYEFNEERAGLASSLEHGAELLERQGDLMGARQRLERALEIRRAFGDKEAMIADLEPLGRIYLANRDPAPATRTYIALRTLHESRQDLAGQASSWMGLARVARLDEKFEEAAAALNRATALYRSADDPGGVGDVLHMQAELSRERGSYEEAYGLDLMASTTRPGDTVIGLSLIDDAVGAGRMAEALTRINWLSNRSMTPLQQVQLRTDELVARVVVGPAASVKRTGDALVAAFAAIPASEHALPALEPVRYYLRLRGDIPREQRETLQGITRVLGIPRSALSQSVLGSQVDALVRQVNASPSDRPAAPMGPVGSVTPPPAALVAAAQP